MAANWREWSEEEVRILEEHYGRMKLASVAAMLPGRSLAAIGAQARDRRLRADRSITNRRSNYNSRFFSEPNPVNSYWAGFLAADGNIRGKTNQLTFYQADPEAVKGFQLAIEHDGRIRCRVRPRTTEYSLSLTSAEMVSDLLRNFSITPNKSLTLKPPPSLNQECSLAFVGGLIDGDGSVHQRKNHQTRSGNPFLDISLTGTMEILTWANAILGNRMRVYHRSDCSGNTYRGFARFRKAREIFGLIFPVLERNGLGLPRKWAAHKSFVEGLGVLSLSSSA